MPDPVSTATAPARIAHDHWAVRVATYLLVAATLLMVMLVGLLPGLLAVCVGFLLTRLLVRLGARFIHDLRSRAARWWPSISAAIVITAPLALLAVGLSHSRGYLTEAPQQYRELLDYVASTVIELRDKLPPDLADYLPDGADEVQRMVANHLLAKAGALATTGKAWLTGLLYAYVGIIIGALAAVHAPGHRTAPLTRQLTLRITRFGEAFQQIVAAQFWIATFNTCLTAIFLLVVMPALSMRLPYSSVLIALTFVAGMIPIVGNLLCNIVVTIVGLSVSPMAAAACLLFLITIHKAEYVINAKVVGQKTHMAVWELLCVMFMAEALFGPAGLVAAPLFYAYLKKELSAARLV
ncbi:permease [Comamonas serinivorans]|uniref:Permease n=1 Tax=Comamonas serinivorans TaxID=1082851 RepID=A0A1Y0EK66_9BURK|nr:AI-2E family transporter [Comamonas serinivorans]ARU03977.1 permease [Comamonas serinivorans]